VREQVNKHGDNK